MRSPNFAAQRDILDAMEELDVYLLAGVEPYPSPRDPVLIDTIVVHALTLLHSDVRQPDGGNIYRCLTAFPGRHSGEIVPLATIAYELAGGRNWRYVGDWEGVAADLAKLAVSGRCDALQLGLPTDQQTMLYNGPTTSHTFEWTDGRPSTTAHPEHRRAVIAGFEDLIRTMVSDGGPFWAGNPLVAPPPYPPVEVYAPATGEGHIRQTFYVIDE